MLPKWHILVGFVVSYLLVSFFNFSLVAGTIIFLSSFLIDFDHYLFYLIKKKSHNLREAYIWFVETEKKLDKLPSNQKEKYQKAILIFHGVEFWLVLAILSFFSPIFIYLLIGIGTHMILDFIDIINKKEPFYQKLSQIYVWQTNKNKPIFK